MERRREPVSHARPRAAWELKMRRKRRVIVDLRGQGWDARGRFGFLAVERG
jgi:hypothetical protein